MEVKKDIGKAFSEKLESLNRLPSDAVWGSISKELDKKRKRKFLFFWIFGLIGLLLTGFITYYEFGVTNNDYKTKHPQTENNNSKPGLTNEGEATVNSETDNLKNAKDANLTNKDLFPKEKKDITTGNKVAGAEKLNTTSGNNKNSKSEHRNARTKNKQTVTNPGTIVATSIINKNKRSKNAITKNNADADAESSSITAKNSGLPNYSDKTTIITSEGKEISNGKIDLKETLANSENRIVTKNTDIATQKTDMSDIEKLTDSTHTLTDSIKIPEQDKDVAKEKKQDSIPPASAKKFSAFVYASPMFFSFPDNTVKTDSTSAKLKTDISLNYGVLFGYNITKKLSVRAGISVYRLKQTANNIKLNYIIGGTAIDPQFIPPADFDWVDYSNGGSNAEIVNTLGDGNNATINITKELSYIEIPFEFTYALFDSKFGAKLLGGGSILMLGKNEVSANNENGNIFLGKWNAATETSFTLSAGIGLHYKLTPSLQVNAEPLFRYYLNTYENSKPYSFSLRLGVQYNFDF